MPLATISSWLSKPHCQAGLLTAWERNEWAWFPDVSRTSVYAWLLLLIIFTLD